jgi:hypothetical protein
MEIYEIVILTVVLIGCSWNAYYIGRREGRKDASQEAMIGTLIFARDKFLLKDKEDIVWQYLNEDMATIVKMVVDRKI